MRYANPEDMVRYFSRVLDACHAHRIPVTPRLHSDLLAWMLAAGL